jgi:hypothetical protein
MAQPKRPPKSIRAPAEVWGLIASVAQAEGIALNAAAALCLKDGANARLGITPGVAPKGQKRAKPTQDVALPRAAKAKAALAQAEERVGVEPIHVELQVGPSPVPPGSRLKGASTKSRWKI